MAAPVSARPGDLRLCGRLVAFACALAAAVSFGACIGVRPAVAQFDNINPQWVGVPAIPKVPTATSTLGTQDPNAQMLVRADELQYDNANNRILALGNVQIYYKGSVLEADRVIYEQNSKRMRAEGNARFTEADGKVVRPRAGLSSAFPASCARFATTWSTSCIAITFRNRISACFVWTSSGSQAR